MGTSLLLILIAVVGFSLVGIILVQQPKDGGMGGSFGGGSGASGSVFGAKGATSFFFKLTGVLALIFVVLTLTLVKVSNKKSVQSSIVDTAPVVETQATDIEIPTTELTAPVDSEIPAATVPTEAPQN